MNTPDSAARTPTPSQGPSATSHVTFALAGETYGVPTALVREVVMWIPVTRIPNAGGCVIGVINLRGEIVAVMDTRLRLGLAPSEPTERSCLVVVNADRGGRRPPVALIVDTALEVTRLISADTNGSDGARVAGEFVSGIAHTKSGLVILLDVDRVVHDGADGALGAS